MKTFTTAFLMAVGIALGLFGVQAESPDGGMLVMGGLLFGTGLHWYRVGLTAKTTAVALLMAMTFPLVAGAVMMGQGLLGLLAFVTGGTALRMVWKGKK